MTSSLEPRKKLALAIIDFLQTSLKDGSMDPDDHESLEVAQNCIAESFHVDPSNKSHMSEALGQQNLLQIYTVYDKLKSTKPAQPSSSKSQSTGTSAANGPSTTTTESEKLKSLGNEAMKAKNLDQAIEYYTKAIDICPTNAIYLSNRAAAHSAQQNFTAAAADAELATAADPTYAKGWSRLGAAKYALSEFKSSVDAYAQAMEVEGGGSDLTKKGYEAAKKKLEEQGNSGTGGLEPDVDEGTRSTPGAAGGGMPDLGALAGMLGGGGQGGRGAGGGGMPDLAGLMSNPMVAQMAQNFMRNPEQLRGMMQDPQVRAAAESMGLGGLGGAGGGGGGGNSGSAGDGGPGAGADRGAGGGGGMPDLASMMQDPAIQEMARNFMGGGGGAGAGRGAGR